MSSSYSTVFWFSKHYIQSYIAKRRRTRKIERKKKTNRKEGLNIIKKRESKQKEKREIAERKKINGSKERVCLQKCKRSKKKNVQIRKLNKKKERDKY